MQFLPQFLVRLPTPQIPVISYVETQIKPSNEALKAAANGQPVVFLDDFIGSGDQFLKTWQDLKTGTSFEIIQRQVNFPAIYVSLVGTDVGISNIGNNAPAVAVCVTHKIDERGTLWGIKSLNPSLFHQVNKFLEKYVPRLTPHEPYMRKQKISNIWI